MNFPELRDLVADYAHRPNDTAMLARIENYFIPFANVRLGRDLRSFANEVAAELDSSTGDPMPLPPDFAAIRGVRFNGPGGTYVLRSAPADVTQTIPLTGNPPVYYSIEGLALTARPFVAGTYPIVYWAEPVLSASNPENAVLTQWPNLYLYACLIELYVWTRNESGRVQAVATYVDEVAAINKAAKRGRAAAPAGIGV